MTRKTASLLENGQIDHDTAHRNMRYDQAQEVRRVMGAIFGPAVRLAASRCLSARRTLQRAAAAAISAGNAASR